MERADAPAAFRIGAMAAVSGQVGEPRAAYDRQAAAPAAPGGQRTLDGVRRLMWTRDAVDRLIKSGVIVEGARIELVEGDLIEMPSQLPPHAVSLGLAEDALRAAFADSFHVRTQLPIALGEFSSPEPDLCVVPGTRRDYLGDHPAPGAIALIVEISDSTLRYDRIRKGSLYAPFGIGDYWILNLPRRVLEVYRDPVPAARAPFGYSYASRTVLPPAAQVAPLAAPGGVLSVADLLP